MQDRRHATVSTPAGCDRLVEERSRVLAVHTRARGPRADECIHHVEVPLPSCEPQRYPQPISPLSVIGLPRQLYESFPPASEAVGGTTRVAPFHAGRTEARMEIRHPGRRPLPQQGGYCNERRMEGESRRTRTSGDGIKPWFASHRPSRAGFDGFRTSWQAVTSTPLRNDQQIVCFRGSPRSSSRHLKVAND